MSRLEQTAKDIFGRRAAFYATSPAHTDPKILARVVALCAPQPHWRALDVATGPGHTAFALAPGVAEVIGVDLTTEMLREAERLRGQRALANIAFCVADVHTLPFQDATFDLVTSRRAPHHFSDITQALCEMNRVLRPCGRLVVDDRSVPDDDFVDTCMNELDRCHDESHVREYRPSEWERMLQAHGFTLDHIEPYTKHRPLTSLTEGASPERAQRIHEIVAHVDLTQRAALNLISVNGELFLNHWFVMVSATRCAH